MPATFRINQGLSEGEIDQSREDIENDGDDITLVAETPDPATYTWEILDAVNTVAVLSANSGAEVDIEKPIGGFTFAGEDGCSLMVRMTATLPDGSIQRSTRALYVLNSLTLPVPLFGENASVNNKLGSNNPKNSLNNSSQTNLAGRGGSAEENWRGWAEWARRLMKIMPTLGGGSAAPQYAVAFITGAAAITFGLTVCSFATPGGAYAVTLPTLTVGDGGKVLIIKNGDNTPELTITPDPAQPIEGETTRLLSSALGVLQLVAVELPGPAYGWFVIGEY